MYKMQNRIIIKNIKSSFKNSIRVAYGFATIPIGYILIGFLPDDNNSICHLHFTDNPCETDIRILGKNWPKAIFMENSALAKRLADIIFSEVPEVSNLSVTVCGTPFQLNVWETLLRVPYGTTCTYSDIAEMMGNPKAVRAVANAVANNDVAVLIPCHRIVSKDGNLSKYRWGSEYKRKLLDYEKMKN